MTQDVSVDDTDVWSTLPAVVSHMETLKSCYHQSRNLFQPSCLQYVSTFTSHKLLANPMKITQLICTITRRLLLIFFSTGIGHNS